MYVVVAAVDCASCKYNDECSTTHPHTHTQYWAVLSAFTTGQDASVRRTLSGCIAKSAQGSVFWQTCFNTHKNRKISHDTSDAALWVTHTWTAAVPVAAESKPQCRFLFILQCIAALIHAEHNPSPCNINFSRSQSLAATTVPACLQHMNTLSCRARLNKEPCRNLAWAL